MSVIYYEQVITNNYNHWHLNTCSRSHNETSSSADDELEYSERASALLDSQADSSQHQQLQHQQFISALQLLQNLRVNFRQLLRHEIASHGA